MHNTITWGAGNGIEVAVCAKGLRRGSGHGLKGGAREAKRRNCRERTLTVAFHSGGGLESQHPPLPRVREKEAQATAASSPRTLQRTDGAVSDWSSPPRGTTFTKMSI